jgi:hypothetical protein
MGKRKLEVEVTPAMSEAGTQLMSDLTVARCCKNSDGIGGSLSWKAWLRKKVKNRDLILRYIKGEITAMAAGFIAMSRARDEEGLPGVFVATKPKTTRKSDV